MSGRLQRMLQAVWPPPMRTEKWKDLIPCRFPVNHLYLQARQNLTWLRIFIHLAKPGSPAPAQSTLWHIDQEATR